jgi:hypothetical protein
VTVRAQFGQAQCDRRAPRGASAVPQVRRAP